jgi:uncharacterized protein YcbX
MRIGTVAGLFRYPVKSMRGEELQTTPVGLQGLPGDRRYAFVQAKSRSPFPWLTGREVAGMLLFRPEYEGGFDGAGREPLLRVRLPDGRSFAVHDDALREALEGALGQPLFLLRDHRGNHDRGQVSLFSLGLAADLSARLGKPVDPRRFRANIYMQPEAGSEVSEADLPGKVLAIGPELRIAVTERDQRCVMITLDPDTATGDPSVLKAVAQEYANCAGVYATVLHAGTVHAGDAVEVVG